MEALLEALAETGYLSGRPRAQVQSTIYRLLGRAEPTARELNALAGFLKALRGRAGARST
jgi:tRNA C32,U32 (ribose-2'-O)-methylase TrmJ